MKITTTGIDFKRSIQVHGVDVHDEADDDVGDAPVLPYKPALTWQA